VPPRAAADVLRRAPTLPRPGRHAPSPSEGGAPACSPARAALARPSTSNAWRACGPASARMHVPRTTTRDECVDRVDARDLREKHVVAAHRYRRSATIPGAIDHLRVRAYKSANASSGNSSWPWRASSLKIELSPSRDSQSSRVDRYKSSCVGARPESCPERHRSPRTCFHRGRSRRWFSSRPSEAYDGTLSEADNAIAKVSAKNRLLGADEEPYSPRTVTFPDEGIARVSAKNASHRARTSP
jgi:hypothetical protein